MKRTLILISTLVMLFGLSSQVALAEDPATGTVSGTVLLDGEPLAGVQVSVWTMGEGEFQGWSTCTDEDGAFSFPDVTTQVDLWAATGPAWDRACQNAMFFDPYSNPERPLMSQFWDHSDGPAASVPPTAFQAPHTGINFEVIRLPNERPAINELARLAITFCFDNPDPTLGSFGSPADPRATAFLDRMLVLVDEDEAKYKVDPVIAQRYRTFADIVGWSWSMTCPAP